MKALLGLMMAISAYAQTSTGTITGTVTDPQQARLAGARVVLFAEETGVSQTVATNEQGEYTFPLLNSGRYRLDVEAGGFQKYSRRDIVVELGRIARIDVAMTLGQVTETVSVSGSAPLLESESATVGQFIEQKTIADMPLNGRRVGELLGLAGNSVFITGDVIRPRVTVAGGRADQQQWLLDGVNASNVALEAPQALFNPPVESVQEIRIQQNAYSAEYGNSSGGVVLTTTRSGGNTFTGSAYEYFRNEKLDARNYFAADRAPLRWNVFGFAIGGPIIRNKTFFFNSTEWQRQRVGATRNNTVPTAAERLGDFSATRLANGNPLVIYDPNTSPRTPFPGARIPENRIDPVGRAIAALYPSPTGAGTNAAGANNFQANAVNALNITTWTTKVDHVFNEKNRMSVRFILHDFPTTTSAVFPEPAADPNGNISDRRAYSMLVEHVHQFQPTVINDLRVNIQPRRFVTTGFGIGEGWPTKLGLRGVDDRAFPRVNVAGYPSMGAGTQERIQTPIWDHHFVDTISWYRGKHSFKVGGEYRYGRNQDIFNQAISGSMTFNVQPTALTTAAGSGNALASLLLGFPNSGSIQATQPIDRVGTYWAAFFQDDWRITSNFTLNVGLRWEAHTPRIDRNDRQSSMDDRYINPVSGTFGIMVFANRDGRTRNLYDGDYNNYAPRIGFAWKPFGSTRTVVRAGYGVFFGPPLPGSNNSAAGFAIQGDFQTPDNGITAPFLLRNGFPATPPASELNAGFGAVRVGQAVRLAPEFIEMNRQLGYSQQWNFLIQRELGWNTLVETGYTANVGHKLNGPTTSVNQVPLNQMGAGNAQIRRPFPQYGNVANIAPMWGNSSYHALNVKAEKRFSDGLNFLVNYTFSKFIDDVNHGFENGAPAGGIQNLYDRQAEKGLSGNDVRHRMVMSGVYELPGKNARGIGWLVGNWSLGAIVTLQGGSPLGFTVQNNNCNCFNPGALRANILRDPTLPSGDRTVQRWFDTSALAAPAQFTFGNAGRTNNVRGPGLQNIDMSIIRTFPIRERFKLQFRGESFNIANRANFEEPGIALGAPTFGVIGSARAARSIQLGLKLNF
ncbi:MAG: carboxypeptidase regulatory-like domain-containing protein [Bryobacteraceae bacterium]|nr:carboxypeptidase regulatory-like domain-containing protein [Bryobacteraceae bacterium]